MKPQTRAVANFLDGWGWITPLAALQQLGCFRLAARIQELRESGWHIVTELERSPTGAVYACYRVTRRPPRAQW